MDTPEEIRKQNIKESNEALAEAINLTSRLADVMRNVVSETRNKGELDKGSLDLSRQAVKLTRDLASEYDSIESVQKDIVKNQKSQNDISKQIGAISQNLNSTEKKAIAAYKEKNKETQVSKDLLAKVLDNHKKGVKVSEDELAYYQRRVANAEEDLSVSGQQLSNQAEQVIFLEAQNEELNKNAAYLAEMERRQQNLNTASGKFTKVLETVSGVLDKLGLGGLSKALKIEEGIKGAKDFAYQLTDGGKKSLSAMGKLKVAIKGVGTAIKVATGPLAILGLLVTQFNKFKERAEEAAKAVQQVGQDTADLGRSLGLSVSKTQELASQAVALGGAMGMTTSQAKAAVGEIYGALDGAEKLTNKTLQTFIKLKKYAGMSADDIKNIYTFSKLSGESAAKVADEMATQAQESIKSLKLNVSMKGLMQDVGKVSNSVKLNFKGSGKELTAAVASAKKLGLEMSQVESIADSLLNIEDSLAAEMEAELLTGKELNLEKARAAALSGDQGKLMEALAEQGITELEYTNMNLIQREALAKAMGMTRDQMAGMLVAQKENNADNVDLIDLQQQGLAAMTNMATVAERLAVLDEQRVLANADAGEKMTKFQEAILRVQTALEPILNKLFIPILNTVTKIIESTANFIDYLTGANDKLTTMDKWVGGISTTILGIVAAYKTWNILVKAGNVLMGIKNGIQGAILIAQGKEEAAVARLMFKQTASLTKSVGMAIMKVISSLASIPVAGWALGLAAAGVVAGLAAKYMNDGVIKPTGGGGYGDRVLYGPEGAISFNNKDTIVAGTNLFKGDDVVSAPEGTVNMNKDDGALLAEMRRVSSLLSQLVNKEGIVMIDGQKVGQALVLGSYQTQ